MPYDQAKHLLGRDAREVTIYAGEDDIQVKIRAIPWSRRNQIASQAVKWDENDRRMFDGDQYFRECLKYMIVEAPWGQTSDTFLSQVGDDLGAALESLIPKAFSNSNNINPDEVKKELSDT